MNGVLGPDLQDGAYFSIAGFRTQFKRPNNHQKKFRIEIGRTSAVGIETFKDFVRVSVTARSGDDFLGSVGLMGSYPEGNMVARDGHTLMDDANAFGKEWQVLSSEPMLFDIIYGPQHPQQCAMPNVSQTARKRRRLGESAITEEAAQMACAHVNEAERAGCEYDVLATNDLQMAGDAPNR